MGATVEAVLGKLSRPKKVPEGITEGGLLSKNEVDLAKVY
jgi:hypothetical protein